MKVQSSDTSEQYKCKLENKTTNFLLDGEKKYIWGKESKKETKSNLK